MQSWTFLLVAFCAACCVVAGRKAVEQISLVGFNPMHEALYADLYLIPVKCRFMHKVNGQNFRSDVMCPSHFPWDQISVHAVFDEQLLVAKPTLISLELESTPVVRYVGRWLPNAERLLAVTLPRSKTQLLDLQSVSFGARELAILETGVEQTNESVTQLLAITDSQYDEALFYLSKIGQNQEQLVHISSSPITPALISETASALTSIQPKTRIQDLIEKMNLPERVKFYATFLTGEHPLSFIRTRQSNSKDGMLAAEWIQSQLDQMGFETTLQTYQDRSGRQYNPNIIAEWPLAGKSGTEETVIVGAHYDDRQRNLWSTTDRAPGANDDGSGSALVLTLAEHISRYQQEFKKRVILIFFSGEEQGLYGSRYYAKLAKERGDKIVAMLQCDMVGYNSKKGKSMGLAFVSGYTTSALTEKVRQITTAYVPELSISKTNACCSDHQSFYEQGFESVGFVEHGGYTVDPEYHHVGDLVNRPGYDIDQILYIGKAVLASLAEIGELL